MYMIFTHNIATGDIIKLKALSFSCHCWFIIVNMLPACLHVSLSISLTIYPSLCLVLGKISIQAQMKDFYLHFVSNTSSLYLTPMNWYIGMLLEVLVEHENCHTEVQTFFLLISDNC